MLSRREMLLGAASAGLLGMAGCASQQSDQSSEPEMTTLNWVPAAVPLPVAIQGRRLSNIVAVEGPENLSDQAAFGLPPAEVDLFVNVQTGEALQCTGIDGSFGAGNARESITTNLTGSFEEVESEDSYTRLRSNTNRIALRDGRVAMVEPPAANDLNELIDTREGNAQRLLTLDDRVNRLWETIGTGDIVSLVAQEPTAETADNDSEGNTAGRVGRAYSITVQSDMSPFVFCYLYQDAATADPAQVREQVSSAYATGSTEATFEVTTDGALVTATGELPTSSLRS